MKILSTLSPEDCIERFSLSAKNPRKVATQGEWTYSSAVGPYGGYAMKQRSRTVFDYRRIERFVQGWDPRTC